MLLKSSDFIVHDLSVESVFEGCGGGYTTNVNIGDNNNSTCNNDDDDQDQDQDHHQDRALSESYKLELVLRKWFAIDPSREMRAFVREGVLIGAFRVFFFFRSSALDIYIYIYIKLSCLISLCGKG